MPTIRWTTGRPDLAIQADDWEATLQAFFDQSAELIDVELRSITAGRSGAVPLIGKLKARRSGGAGQNDVVLQSEFVKMSELTASGAPTEAELFATVVAGTELVHGRSPARGASRNPSATLEVYGYTLYDAGEHVVPLWVAALHNEARVHAVLSDLTLRLRGWYGSLALASPPDLAGQHVAGLLGNIGRHDPQLATTLGPLLTPILVNPPAGACSRVHYDLHTENILVEPEHFRAHVIDFGSLRLAGSPCVDLARLESDIIYRLLPLRFTAADMHAFETDLWNGGVAASATCAGRLVRSLRFAAAPILESPNAALFWVVGRILHAARMLGGTWSEVLPYDLIERQRAIVESVRALTAELQRQLTGHAARPLAAQSPGRGQDATGEVIDSMRWLILNRRNDGAFRMASRLVDFRPKRWPREIFLLGALGGLVARRPANQTRAMIDESAGAPMTTVSRGLLALCEGLWKQRHNPTGTPTDADFRAAAGHFSKGQDAAFLAINDDQWARACQRLGKIDEAKRHFQDSIKSKRDLGDRAGLGASLGGLAGLMVATGDYIHAVEVYLEDLEIVQSLGDSRGEAQVLCRLGQARCELLDINTPLAHLDSSLRLAEQLLSPGQEASTDTAFAHVSMAFFHAYWGAVPQAFEFEARARGAFESVVDDDQTRRAGVALCEIAAGAAMVRQSLFVSAEMRMRSGLSAIASMDQVGLLDYGIRTARFLQRQGRPRDWLIDILRERLGVKMPADANGLLLDMRDK